MPITLSAKKKMHQDEKRHQVNLKVTAKMKKAVKLAQKEPNVKNLQTAYSEIDTACKKNVIHRNKASRLKSRLTKKQNKSLNK